MEADHAATLTDTAHPPAPPGIAFMAGEDVLLLAVAMPEMSQVQRRAAVAFAVEDRIARPLEEVHVILGPALPAAGDGRRWLVAVIAQDVLEAVPPLRRTRLLPDFLALPVPEAGQWSVWAGGARVLVRTADGAGFATSAATLLTYHLVAGQPDIVLYGGALDAQFAVPRLAELPTRLDPSLQRFDLNAARAAARSVALPRAWRQTAVLMMVAGLGHIGLLVADTWALGRISDMSQTSVRDALGTIGQPAGDDLDAAILATLARTNGTDGPQFVPLMARVFAALADKAGQVTTSDLRYAADQNSLTITVQAPDITTLQDVETALTTAGFRVTAGAATTGDGLAEQQLTLWGDGT